jgi:uncharacterized membrane protein
MHIIRAFAPGRAQMSGPVTLTGLRSWYPCAHRFSCEALSMVDSGRSWRIKRNCSASPTQVAWVFASIVAVSFAFGAVFAAQGLWLVLPFVGIETLAVAAAFFCHGRRAADYEKIEIVGGEIAVEQVEGSQRTVRRLPSPWARVELQRLGRTGRVTVWLAAGAQRIEVGRHLLDARRVQLAEELRMALARPLPA